MKAMLGIFLYSCPYFSYYCLFLLFNRTGEKFQVLSGSEGGRRGEGGGKGQGGEMAQTMYAHIHM
jgi:hypothetical protein